MTTTLQDLIKISRRKLDDSQAPYRWPDDVVTDWLNEAQLEACRRAHLIVSSTRYSVALNTSNQTYSLTAGIIQIRRAKLSLVSTPLQKVSYRDLDELFPGWQGRTGTPRFYATDLDTGSIVVYPQPSASDTLNLVCVCEPAAKMVNYTDAAALSDRHCYSLPDWVAYRAFSEPDPDSEDPRRAERHLAAFEGEFGKRNSALSENFDENNYPIGNYDGSY